MALAVFNQALTQLMKITGIIQVSATISLIEVEVNRQSANITEQ